MAKIGSEWIWKAHKRRAIRPDDPHGEVASMEPIYRETHYCMRSDGVLLQRKVSAYPDHFSDGEIRRIDLGWKKYRKVAKGVDIAHAAEVVQQQLTAKGFDIDYADGSQFEAA